ncbi:hypothetical protein ZWY2020_057514 [Hordeum vulgare]|nr:hypothetical protein ZWY2020_057514 [Hordeum vulgare]
MESPPAPGSERRRLGTAAASPPNGDQAGTGNIASGSHGATSGANHRWVRVRRATWTCITMAEVVAAMAIRPLVSMLVNKAGNSLLDQYKVMEGMEEQHKVLKRKLPAILDIMTDAEEQATEHRDGAKAWLQELKIVAYEANEVFDEFKRGTTELGFDVVKLFPTHNRFAFRHRMGRKLCLILQAVEVLIAEMQVFGFKYQPQSPVSKEWRHTDYVIIDPQEIASESREKDKKNIVDILLGQTNNAELAVVPIIGMGGLGKTTLAQLIYNDSEIQSISSCCFGSSIVEASPSKNVDTDNPPPPLDRLQKLVSGRRYLLVLDDVWDNKELRKWERLKVCLHGGMGSAVLTTTRDKRVAEIMGADRAAYNLNALEDRFIKKIIEARAFTMDKQKPAELVEIVDEIVKKCCGSPVAATALAISSRSSICTDETGILPILKLSYNDLPAHMKQCFAFCAMFPKDYKINVEKLIQLWIANGFIPKHEEDNLETIGKHIFDELASKSFFLDIEKYENSKGNYSITTCKIHDLMHDIAMSVMGKECVVTEESSQIEWLHRLLAFFPVNPAIQTLLCNNLVSTSWKHLSKYRSLHALDLKETESFSFKPKYLHHLRYLDLSYSYIEALPEDISILYNLQTLDLSNCSYLDRLPRQMKYMTSLRHLYTHGCRRLKSMPPELGKLTRLQTLTCFIAGVTGVDCSDVEELQHLNLGGQLELLQVENVEKAEAQVLKIYSYGGQCMGMLQNVVEIHLFHCERLQFLFRRSTSFTFPRLKVLMLEHLLNLERWWEINERQEEQTTFPVLEKLFLSNCGKLVALPKAPLLQGPCGEGGYTLVHSAFPSLKVLEMEDLESFQRWDAAEETQGEQMVFPHLEELSIQECPKLTTLPEAPLLQEPCSEGGYRLVRSAFPALKVLKMKRLESFRRWDAATEGEPILFPQLEKLSIKECPKIINLPEAPKLGVLEIEDGKQEIFHCVNRFLSSLNNLILKLEYVETTSEVDCTSIVPVESKDKRNLPVMQLRCCNSFFGAVEIGRCDVLVHWPLEVFHNSVSLRKLVIRECKNLTGYTQVPLKPSATERSQCLPGLESLELKDCASLVEMFNVPASLKIMDIELCPKLESISGKQQDMSELIKGLLAVRQLCSCTRIAILTHGTHLSRPRKSTFISMWKLTKVLNLPPSLKVLEIIYCSSIQVVSCQLGGLQKPEVSTTISRSPIMLKPLAAVVAVARDHLLPPDLECLIIQDCAGMLVGLSVCLHPSRDWTLLTTRAPSSLKFLDLQRCTTLASLPNEPQVYSSLWFLKITGLMPLKPKTWKEIPRLVRSVWNLPKDDCSALLECYWEYWPVIDCRAELKLTVLQSRSCDWGNCSWPRQASLNHISGRLRRSALDFGSLLVHSSGCVYNRASSSLVFSFIHHVQSCSL